jgi:hypothetical protein
VRSSGAGGQNVNKVSSKVVLTFDLVNSKGLKEEEKQLLQTKIATKLTQEGILIITSQEDRSQLKNKEIALSHELVNGFKSFSWAQKLNAEAKVKLYWFDNKTKEAIGGMHILLDVVGSELGASLLSWFCMQQLEQVDSPEKSTCVELETVASQNRELRSQLDVSLALLKARSVTNKSQIGSEDMSAWFIEKGWPELVEYYSNGREKKDKVFLKKLDSLLLKYPENLRISSFIKDELNNIHASMNPSNLEEVGPTLRLPASDQRGSQ